MIATTVLAAQLAGTLDLTDTTSLRARVTSPTPLVTTPRPGKIVMSADAYTAPLAKLGVGDRHATFSLTYAPVVTAVDMELGLDPQVWHTGIAAFAWRGRETSLTLSEVATYGQLDSAFLYQQPPGPGQTTAVQTTVAPGLINVGSSATYAGVTFQSDRRTTWSAFGAYTTGGGLDAHSRATLSEQYGASGGASMSNRLSIADTVTTLASVQSLTTDGLCPPPLTGPPPATPSTAFCLAESEIGILQETLRHNVSSRLYLSASAGIAVTAVTSTVFDELVILPVAIAGVTRQFGVRDALQLSVQLSPSIDMRTGIASERVQATATLLETVAPGTVLAATAAALHSTPIPRADPYDLSLVSGQLETRFLVDRQATLALGLQGSWETQMGFLPVGAAIGYVSVTGRSQTLHF